MHQRSPVVVSAWFAFLKTAGGIGLASLAGALLSGCAYLNSIKHLDSIADERSEVLVLDAKQRALWIKQSQDDFGKVFCSEASPDVFSVYAASGSASVTTPERLAIALSGSSSETGTSMVNRTAVIQAFKEFGYRFCEAYMNRALDGPSLGVLLRRNQTALVTALAVEQLTGAARPSYVSIGGRAEADTGDKLYDAQKNLEKAREDEKTQLAKAEASAKAADDAKKKYEEKKKEADAAPANATLKQEAEKLRGEAETAAKTASADESAAKEKKLLREAHERIRDAAMSVSSSTSGFAAFSQAELGVPPNKDASQHIASAVKEMVNELLNKDYTRDTCINIVASTRFLRPPVLSETITPAFQTANPSVIAKMLQDASDRQKSVIDYCLRVLSAPQSPVRLGPERTTAAGS